MTINTDKLYQFITKAGVATYAGGGKYEKKSERKDFLELTHKEGDFFYRDSYTGFYRSRGMELVRFKSKPIWSSLYGGGMVDGQNKLAKSTFDFLKQAMLKKDISFQSFRGPKIFSLDNWLYQYQQEGDVEEFHGFEQIFYQKKLVFYHRVIGGTIEHRQ